MNKIKRGVNKFYIGEDEKSAIAEITFIPKGGDRFVVNHTFVDESLRGKGIAQQLLDEVVELARKENRKIIPHCSYVKVMMDRYEQYKDVLAEEGTASSST